VDRLDNNVLCLSISVDMRLDGRRLTVEVLTMTYKKKALALDRLLRQILILSTDTVTTGGEEINKLDMLLPDGDHAQLYRAGDGAVTIKITTPVKA